MSQCSEFTCPNPVYSRGLCKKHYNSFYNEIKRQLLCIVPDCGKIQRRRKLCNMHYEKIVPRSVNGKKETDSNGKKDDDEIDIHRDTKQIEKCSFEGCENELIYNKASKLCSMHYQAKRREKKKKDNSDYQNQNSSLNEFRSFVTT